MQPLPPFDPLDPTVDFNDVPEEEEPVIGRSRKRPPAFEPDMESQQVAGGGWSVASYAERNRIPHDYRREGITTCYVKPDRTLWRLIGGTRNRFWVLVTAATGTANPNPGYIHGGTPASKGPLTRNPYI